jgi:hypothetical protein
MSFTYDRNLTDSTDKVRFYIQDTSLNSGPKPDSTNFSDEEIDGVVTAEGTWQRAVAAMYEILAASWSAEVDISVGPRHESLSQAAGRYQDMATQWRTRYGIASSGTSRVGSRSVTRVDGYSSDVASDEV